MSETADEPLDALDRLVAIARSDTGQARRVANSLRAWWNAKTCGGFDLTDLWQIDDAIVDDILLVMKRIASILVYPHADGRQAEFGRLVADWRPKVSA